MARRLRCLTDVSLKFPPAMHKACARGLQLADPVCPVCPEAEKEDLLTTSGGWLAQIAPKATTPH